MVAAGALFVGLLVTTFAPGLVGRPGEVSPYVVRMHVPAGTHVQPHVHDHDRVYTVLEGTLSLGKGQKVGESEMRTYPTGSVIVVPKHEYLHYAAGDAPCIIQITAVGRAPS